MVSIISLKSHILTTLIFTGLHCWSYCRLNSSQSSKKRTWFYYRQIYMHLDGKISVYVIVATNRKETYSNTVKIHTDKITQRMLDKC